MKKLFVALKLLLLLVGVVTTIDGEPLRRLRTWDQLQVGLEDEKEQERWDDCCKRQNLVQHMFLEAHDAAMAYLSPFSTHCHHYKTQSFHRDVAFHQLHGQYPSGFSSLLDCGARVLDLRLKRCPFQTNIGDICLHHGTAELNHVTFESELPSIIRWAKENPDELVLLKLVPDNTLSGNPDPVVVKNVNKLLHDNAITSIDNFHDVNGCWGKNKTKPPWSYSQAKSLHIIGVWKYDIGNSGQPTNTSCANDNFDPSIGYNPHDAAGSFERLFEYVNNTLQHQFEPHGPNSPNAYFQELQLLWQSHGTEIHYPLFAYHLLLVNYESQINNQTLHAGLAGNLTGANWLKMNNLCLHGPTIAHKVLGTKIAKHSLDTCAAMCGGLDIHNPCS